MQQPPDPPELDLGRLPGRHEPATPATPASGDRLDDHTLLEVEAARQRQLEQGFARGRRAGPPQGSGASWALWAGLGTAVAVALAVALVAIIQASLGHQP